MSMKALVTVFFFFALSFNAFAQVTGGSTTGTTPGTTGTIPDTTDNIPGTTQLPPPTTQFPNPTTQLPPQSTIPDFSQDNTNITGRFDTFDNNAGTAGTGSIFTDDVVIGDDTSAISPEIPDTLDSGIFEDDPETPMDDTVLD